MRYVYDFDSTLFSTERLWQAERAMIISAGFDPEVVDETGDQAARLGYSPRKHMEMLGMDADVIVDIIERFEVLLRDDAPSFVFADVIPFINARKDHSHSVLTIGDEGHQREKLLTSGIDKLIPNITIARPEETKASHLLRMLEQEQKLIFIDDNPTHLITAHEAKLPIDLVRIKRKGEYYAIEPHELDDVAWRVITSLSEIET